MSRTDAWPQWPFFEIRRYDDFATNSMVLSAYTMYRGRVVQARCHISREILGWTKGFDIELERHAEQQLRLALATLLDTSEGAWNFERALLEGEIVETFEPEEPVWK